MPTNFHTIIIKGFTIGFMLFHSQSTLHGMDKTIPGNIDHPETKGTGTFTFRAPDGQQIVALAYANGTVTGYKAVAAPTSTVGMPDAGWLSRKPLVRLFVFPPVKRRTGYSLAGEAKTGVPSRTYKSAKGTQHAFLQKQVDPT